MGSQAEAALNLFVSDANAGGGVILGSVRHELSLECIDDESRADRCAEIYRTLCSNNRIDVLLGPYSSEMTRAAASVARDSGMLLVNHGGADDAIFETGNRMIVGVLSAASDYFKSLATLLASLKFWRKRLAIIAGPGSFALDVINGLERECKTRAVLRRGVRIRLKQIRVRESAPDLQAMLQRIRRNRINALVSAGSFEDDVAVMKAITDSEADVPVLACVAAGVHRFRTAMGEAAEGVIGPSQWEHQVELKPELGPSAQVFARRMRSQGANGSCDYPAAQAYAAGLLSIEALKMVGRVDQQGMRVAFGDLRTTTLFGDFAIDRVTGKQFGHKVLLVQWHDSEKVVIHPAAHTEVGLLELPSGWQLLLASLQSLRLKRPEGREPEDDADQDKP